MARNPDYDMTFDCNAYDAFGVYGGGWLRTSVAIEGEFQGIGVIAEAMDLGDVLIQGTQIFSAVWEGSSLDLGNVSIEAEIIISPPVTNWVRWGEIGEFDFAIDRKNVAGEMPLDWPGAIYHIMKLDSSVMVYGSGGVTQLVPHNNFYGMKTLSRVGVKGQWAVGGDENMHLFVDKKGCLIMLTDKYTPLGYEEFFLPMTSPVLSYDPSEKMAYICDGTVGYVYSVEEQSLGSGPANVTGIGFANGYSYLIASGDMEVPLFEITSDTWDFETRGNKTIHEIEVGGDTEGRLEALVEFSKGLKQEFIGTGWRSMGPNGLLSVPCFGKDFRFSLRCPDPMSVKIDYIRVKGVIHNFSPIDV